jgi:predicted GIY-YIG superfamily endonuclease
MNRKDRYGLKPPDSAWFVYLLRCADGSLYTWTNDVGRWLKQETDCHSKGLKNEATQEQDRVISLHRQLLPQSVR